MIVGCQHRTKMGISGRMLWGGGWLKGRKVAPHQIHDYVVVEWEDSRGEGQNWYPICVVLVSMGSYCSRAAQGCHIGDRRLSKVPDQVRARLPQTPPMQDQPCPERLRQQGSAFPGIQKLHHDDRAGIVKQASQQTESIHEGASYQSRMDTSPGRHFSRVGSGSCPLSWDNCPL